MTDKDRVCELFKSGRTLEFYDIVTELDIDLRTVVGICLDLMEHGDIAVDKEIE